MKKRIVKSVGWIVIICCLFNFSIYAQDQDVDESIVERIESNVTQIVDNSVSSMKEIVETEAPAKEQYSSLLSQINASSQKNRMVSNGVNLNEYYGGAYLNDAKKLTICVTTDNPDVISDFRVAAGSADIVIRQVEYRYKDLNEWADSFNALWAEYRNNKSLNSRQREVISDIVESYTDVFENKVIVGIYGLNQEKISIFWEMFDLPINAFCLQGSEKNSLYMTVRPGSSLFENLLDSTESGWPHGSAGYRAYRVNSGGTNVYGFTTAGHMGAAMSRLYRGGTHVGNLYDYRFGGEYDIAFYDATSGTTLSNRTAFSDDTGNSTEAVSLSPAAIVPSQSVLAGSTIMKVGSRTFFTMGTINSFNHTAMYGNVTLNNLYRTTVEALAGDSGGAVFVENNGLYCVIGLISGGNGSVSYVSKYTETALDSRLYKY